MLGEALNVPIQQHRPLLRSTFVTVLPNSLCLSMLVHLLPGLNRSTRWVNTSTVIEVYALLHTALPGRLQLHANDLFIRAELTVFAIHTCPDMTPP